MRICLSGKQHQPPAAQFQLELLWSSPQGSEFPTATLYPKTTAKAFAGVRQPPLRGSFDSFPKFPPSVKHGVWVGRDEGEDECHRGGRAGAGLSFMRGARSGYSMCE